MKRLSPWSIAVSLFALVWSLPMLWVIIVSLQPNEMLRKGGAGALSPRHFTLDNYIGIYNVSLTPVWLFNSFVVAFVTTILTLLVSSLAGFALARIPFRGRTAVFFFLLAGMMIPGQAVVLPLHAMFSSWQLHNTYTALIWPRLAGPFGTLLMMQFFKAIPEEIEEAAELDNAGRLRIFFTIMLPMSLPALATLGIFTFLSTWNDFFWPLISATDSSMYTITVGLSSLQGNFAQSEGLGSLMATAVFACLPMVLIYVFFQHYIVQGLAGGISDKVERGAV